MVGSKKCFESPERIRPSSLGSKGEGGCYISYGTQGIPVGTAMDSTEKCFSGFTNKGIIGTWGFCATGSGNGAELVYFLPAGGNCASGWSILPTAVSNREKAHLCCQ